MPSSPFARWLYRWLGAVIVAVVAAVVCLVCWACMPARVQPLDTSAGFSARQKTGDSPEEAVRRASRRLGVDPADQMEFDE